MRGKLKLPRECLDHNGDTCMSAAPVDKCGSIAVHNPDYFGDMLVCSGNGEGCTYRRGGSVRLCEKVACRFIDNVDGAYQLTTANPLVSGAR